MTISIVAAQRSPIGSLMGSLSSLTAAELGAQVLSKVLVNAKIEPTQVNEVIMGQVLTAGVGQGPARQASRGAGIPNESTATSINQLCGSGLRAIALGAQQILTGQAQVVLAGGQESMSRAPHAQYLRAEKKLGNLELIDTMMLDGLVDAFHGYPMGITAENIAQRWSISRKQQDDYAVESQQRYATAQKSGAFNEEITPISVLEKKNRKSISVDEYPRPETSSVSLASLKPAFAETGTVTAGNASGINDGAAAVALLGSDQVGSRDVLGIIKSFATAGVDPAIMGTGPIPASREALQRAGWTLKDLDLIESNEAFAAQALCIIQELNLNTNHVNVNGGAIALGHPIGASGARILVTLLHALRARGGGRGLATLCIGGGMGVAMCVEV